jgi:hypothetical protein
MIWSRIPQFAWLASKRAALICSEKAEQLTRELECVAEIHCSALITFERHA